MSNIALTRQKPGKEPSKPIGRPRKYKFDKFQDRKEDASIELGFPVSREAARNQFKGRIFQWARYYYNTHPDSRLDFGQLLHFGEIGVMEAYARFDASVGVQFNTFCDPWIRTTIRKNLHREIDPVVKTSTKEYYKALKKGFDAYENGQDPSKLSKRCSEVYYRLESGKISVEDFKNMLSKMRKRIERASELESLDMPVYSDDTKETEKDRLVSPYLDVNETSLDYELIMQRVRFRAYSLIASGKPFRTKSTRAKARVVFEQSCFKDEDDKKATFKEIAERFGVSKQSIDQIHKRLMKNLIPRLISDPIIKEAASAYIKEEQA